MKYLSDENLKENLIKALGSMKLSENESKSINGGVAPIDAWVCLGDDCNQGCNTRCIVCVSYDCSTGYGVTSSN